MNVTVNCTGATLDIVISTLINAMKILVHLKLHFNNDLNVTAGVNTESTRKN